MSPPGTPRSPARLEVRLAGGRSYPVVVGRGASEEVADHVARLRASRVVVVTDLNLRDSHAAAVAARLRAGGRDAPVLAFPPGEAGKTRATKEWIEDRMLASGCGRDAAVVAVGGGVVGDVAGFAAATYMRGVPVVQVPTTLLAMADAAVGGKTGVNHPLGKNLIGAFHQPAAVLADPDFLATLPLPEFRTGLAEVAKAGVVGDAALFEAMEGRAADLARGDAESALAPLERAIAVKIAVVSADETEADLRKVLNFGHTVGHAVERASGWAVTHGEAVAVGMAAEAAMSARLGLMPDAEAARIAALAAALGLPARLPAGMGPEEVLAAASTDKKARGGRLEFALPAAVGRMARGASGYGIPVPERIALECLAALRSGA